MSNRVQVGSGVQDQQLDVVAAPVNTFNPNAGDAASAKLAGLAQGLSQIAPEINRYAEVQQTKDNAFQTQKGLDAASELSRSAATAAELVRKGKMSPVQNPFFMLAFHEQLGRVIGDREYADLLTARQGDVNLDTTTNQQDFVAFDAAHHAQWMKDNIPDSDQNSSFLTGYNSRMNAYAEAQTQKDANEIARRIGTQSNDAQHDEQMTNIQQNIRAGKTPQQIADDLNTANSDLFLHGRDKSQVLQTTVKAIYDAALQDPHNGMAILEAMKSVKGAFGSVANSVYGTAAYTKGVNDVGEAVARDHKLVNQQHQEATDAAVDLAYRQVAALRAADPHADIDDIKNKLAQVAPKEAASLSEFARNLQGSTITTNDAVQSDLLSGIYTEGGETTTFSINQALQRKQITWQTAAEDYQKLDEYEKMKKDGKGPLDPQYNRALAELKGRFTAGDGAVFTADSAERYNRAQGTFTADFAAFLNTEEGKKAGWKEKNEWFVHEADAVAAQYSGSIYKAQTKAADFSGQANRTPTAVAPAPAAPAAGAPAKVTYPAMRVVPIADLLAFANAEKAGGAPSQFVSDSAKAIAAKYGAKSPADFITFMHAQINTNP